MSCPISSAIAGLIPLPKPSSLPPHCTPDPQPDNPGHRTPQWTLNSQRHRAASAPKAAALCHVRFCMGQELSQPEYHDTAPRLWDACEGRAAPHFSDLISTTFLVPRMGTWVTCGPGPLCLSTQLLQVHVVVWVFLIASLCTSQEADYHLYCICFYAYYKAGRKKIPSSLRQEKQWMPHDPGTVITESQPGFCWERP